MQWFYNLKIASKLLIGFVLVAIIAGVIGVIGITKIKHIAEADMAMYELNTKPMEPILAVAVSFQRIRVNYREIALEESAEGKQKFANRIKELDKVIDDQLPEIEKSLKSDETKKAFAEIKTELENLPPISTRSLPLPWRGRTTRPWPTCGAMPWQALPAPWMSRSRNWLT